MKRNPSITELFNEEKYELVTTLGHSQIKEFVFNQIRKNGKLTLFYMIYQLIMILTGILFLAYAVYSAFEGDSGYLKYTILGVIFSFSLMVVLHELMHGIALKLTGASTINYGGDLKKFIFYAEADKHVLNRKQFYFIALTPLVLVNVISIVAILILLTHSSLFFFVILLSLHSLFCAGDIALMNFFYSRKNVEIYTFDNYSERKSYFFKRI